MKDHKRVFQTHAIAHWLKKHSPKEVLWCVASIDRKLPTKSKWETQAATIVKLPIQFTVQCGGEDHTIRLSPKGRIQLEHHNEKEIKQHRYIASLDTKHIGDTKNMPMCIYTLCNWARYPFFPEQLKRFCISENEKLCSYLSAQHEKRRLRKWTYPHHKTSSIGESMSLYSYKRVAKLIAQELYSTSYNKKELPMVWLKPVHRTADVCESAKIQMKSLINDDLLLELSPYRTLGLKILMGGTLQFIYGDDVLIALSCLDKINPDCLIVSYLARNKTNVFVDKVMIKRITKNDNWNGVSCADQFN